jgi:hypothetical protein
MLRMTGVAMSPVCGASFVTLPEYEVVMTAAS